MIVTRYGLMLYNADKSSKGGDKLNEESLKNLEKKYTLDTVSDKRKSQLKRILSIWFDGLQMAKRNKFKGVRVENQYPTFVTLTLSSKQVHTDNFIKRHLLGRFIERLQRGYLVKFWFWTAETQANGNIHFHLIIDKYISHVDIRREWNLLQKSYGYHDKEISKENSYGYNSTDIKRVKDLLRCLYYLVNYCFKKSTNRPVSGRKTGIATQLLNIEQCSYDLSKYEAHFFESSLSQENIDCTIGSHFIYISLNNEFYQTFEKTKYFAYYKKHCEKIYRLLYEE
jgi:hypothetical protein